MKQLLSFITIAILFISANGFKTKTTGKEQVISKPRIEILFTRDLNYDDLVKIRQDLAGKGISIEYNRLEFDKKKKLKKLGFFVDCNDGFSGGAGISHISTETRFGFYRDFDENTKVHFFAGVF